MDIIYSFTLVGLTNYYLELRSDYSTEIILYALVTLDFLYIFYFFKIPRHYLGIFQYNQKKYPSVNQIPDVYGAIPIATFPWTIP